MDTLTRRLNHAFLLLVRKKHRNRTFKWSIITVSDEIRMIVKSDLGGVVPIYLGPASIKRIINEELKGEGIILEEILKRSIVLNGLINSLK